MLELSAAEEWNAQSFNQLIAEATPDQFFNYTRGEKRLNAAHWAAGQQSPEYLKAVIQKLEPELRSERVTTKDVAWITLLGFTDADKRTVFDHAYDGDLSGDLKNLRYLIQEQQNAYATGMATQVWEGQYGPGENQGIFLLPPGAELGLNHGQLQMRMHQLVLLSKAVETSDPNRFPSLLKLLGRSPSDLLKTEEGVFIFSRAVKNHQSPQMLE